MTNKVRAMQAVFGKFLANVHQSGELISQISMNSDSILDIDVFV